MDAKILDMTNSVQDVRDLLRRHAHPEKAKILQQFFKTGKGEYGEGDVFLGLTVPQVRAIALQFKILALSDIKQLLKSTIHEERLIALFILVHQFQKGNEFAKQAVYEFYLHHTKRINNWDLVDLSAPKIVGSYLLHTPKEILYTLAKSKSVWERRIAIIATITFIQDNSYDDTLHIAKLLLNDPHDLIHKAVGWMLREIGKRSLKTEETFLHQYYKYMPRTMLRYAIERFPEHKRQAYLRGSI